MRRIVLGASVPFWQLRGSLVLAVVIAAVHWIAPRLQSQTDRKRSGLVKMVWQNVLNRLGRTWFSSFP